MSEFSYRDVVKRIKKLGFCFFRQCRGSHELWKHPTTDQFVLLSKHSTSFKKKTVARIAKELGFKTLKDFENFGKK